MARAEYDAAEWSERDPDRPLTIVDGISDPHTRTERTATMPGWDWIIRDGRIYTVCSVEAYQPPYSPASVSIQGERTGKYPSGKPRRELHGF